MDLKEALAKQNEYWMEKRNCLSKDEVKYISNKDTFRNKMKGFLTLSYYKRDKLIRTGNTVIGYVYKEWTNDMDGKQNPLIWVLTSPESKLLDNPSIFEKTAANLTDFASLPGGDMKERRLKAKIKSPFADVRNLEIPQSLTGGHLIYLSVLTRPLDKNSFFELGFNFFISNPAASKETILLSERYLAEEIKDMYLNGEFIAIKK